MTNENNPEAGTSGQNDNAGHVTGSVTHDTTSIPALTSPKTYQEVEPLYRNLSDLLPLPAGEKASPPSGFTGGNPDYVVDDAVRARWANRNGNFGLRMPDDIIGLDFDTYTSKDGHEHNGADTLAEREKELGALPETKINTRRGETIDPRTSGHRFFRLPADAVGKKFKGTAGPCIDVLQPSHRHAVVWPSVVDGLQYRWYNADGSPMDHIPRREELPELPRPWVDLLLSGVSQKQAAAPASAQVSTDIEADMLADDREPCDVVRGRVEKTLADFAAAKEGSRHGTMVSASFYVVSACVEGHSGFSWAVEQLRTAWQNEVDDSRADEFEDMVSGAVSKLAGEHDVETWSPITPHYCTGISDSVPLSGSDVPYSVKVTEHIQLHPDSDPDLLDDREAIFRALDRPELSEKEKEEGVDPMDKKPYKSDANYDLIMATDPDLRHLYFDELMDFMCWDKAPSWRNPLRAKSSGFKNLTDIDLIHIRRRLASYIPPISKEVAVDLATIYATHPARQSNPFVAYLQTLEWDGVQRFGQNGIMPISTVENTEYTRAALRNFYLAIITRSMEPGCQLDSMLILVGGQGVRKTSFFLSIADGIPGVRAYTLLTEAPEGPNLKDIDARRHRTPVVIFDEFDQLSGLKDQKTMKGDLSKREDEWRTPYGRFPTAHDRKFVMCGTTNDDQFLTDETGARRQWPVRVGSRIPTRELSREHQDQMLAEAMVLYCQGERPRYDDEFEALANAYRAGMTFDPVAVRLADWLENPVDTNGMTVPVVNLTTGYIEECAGMKASDFNMSKRGLQGKIRAYMDGRDDYVKKDGVRIPGKSAQRGWSLKDPTATRTIAGIQAQPQPYGTGPGYDEPQPGAPSRPVHKIKYTGE